MHGYSLDPGHVPTPFMSGTFMLTRPGMRMPRTGRVYAANLGHRKGWSRDVQAHIDDLGHTKSLRYIGTLVSDVHRTLLYGGVFLYPASMKRPQGKIRLIYEAAPLAFLLEQAGGGASTGRERILALQPSGLTQCAPVAFGSLLDVEEYVRTCGAMGVRRGAAGGYIEGVRVSGDGDGLPEGGCMSRSASELALEGRGAAEEDDSDGISRASWAAMRRTRRRTRTTSRACCDSEVVGGRYNSPVSWVHTCEKFPGRVSVESPNHGKPQRFGGSGKEGPPNRLTKARG